MFSIMNQWRYKTHLAKIFLNNKNKNQKNQNMNTQGLDILMNLETMVSKAMFLLLIVVYAIDQ
jgi:hypothetical protein